MKHFRLVGLCLVAVFAIGAFAASAAMAAQTEPYFVAKKSTLPMTGTATLPEGHLYIPSEGLTITCKKGTGAGEITNIEEGGQKLGVLEKTSVTFEGCTVEEAAHCEVASDPEGVSTAVGTIKTVSIKGRLGYEPKDASAATVRFDLYPTKDVYPAKTEEFTTLVFSGKECTLKGEKVKITGNVVGSIPSTDINTPLTKANLDITVTTGHEQTYTHIENPASNKLGSVESRLLYGKALASLEAEALLTLTAGDEVEVNAS